LETGARLPERKTGMAKTVDVQKKEVKLRESKEFQLKVDCSKILGDKTPVWDDNDKICEAVSNCLKAVIKKEFNLTPKLTLDRWERVGIRFDTKDGVLKSKKLTLAIEGQQLPENKTKLKCKQHHFIPEMLYDAPELPNVYPNGTGVFDYTGHDATLKLEQDIHLDNIKYCATGSLYIEGDKTADFDVSKQAEATLLLGFFSNYFTNLKLASLKPKDDLALVPVQWWDEVIYDMKIKLDSDKIDNWMLVTRWKKGASKKENKLVESELSFKFRKGKKWDNQQLVTACNLYDALGKEDKIFKQLPPIFTFADPVSSIEIKQ
jgi:hypothetical protein